MTIVDTRSWYPIARSDEAPPRHVYQAQLFGYEFAVWRDDRGLVNVWENRCPHRGLRLSLGINTGTELRCQYHGWTYESQSGACTHVPAHPDLSEPSKACALSIATLEQEGFIWTAFDPLTAAPDFAIAASGTRLTLRSLPINRDVAAVRAALASYRFNTDGGDAEPAAGALREISPHIVELSAGGLTLYFLLQPATPQKTVLHAILAGDPCAYGDAARIRRHHAQLMNMLRAQLESAAPPAATMAGELPRSTYPAVPMHKLLPVRRPPKRDFSCRVVRRQLESEGVISLELASADPALSLPLLAPGAHLNLTTPSGLVRQYSVVNGPSERTTIIIGIKLEPDSRGGSKSMHEAALDGTLLQASVPRNTFPLAPSGKLPILVAGGIGITPLISMAQALHARGQAFELHYFVRSADYVSFKARLSALGDAVRLHVGLDPQQTGAMLREILHGRPLEQSKVYACGPGPMLAAVKDTALAGGIAADDIHFEYFKNDTQQAPGAPFTVRLKRSAREFDVPPGKTLLHALHEQGIEVEASCEQGVCGSCFTSVLAGDIEHHDLYLSAAEKASGKCLMPCVSRARAGTLVLDL
jgi:ferredoxin-NADP reductase/nitrite reductase/ring-hydroxylating ferredoxin subunit